MSADWDASLWSCAGPVGARAPKDAPEEDRRGFPSHILPPHRNLKGAAKRLKPDKWRAAFDSEGKPSGFHKLLKSIALGGVDHAIRAEVWEFLLGCYSLDTTAAYRQELRAARRDRYQKLIEQCQKMHSSVGTGSLAYAVGSKVMDVRIMSKDSARDDTKWVNLEAEAGDSQSEAAVGKLSSASSSDGTANSPQGEAPGDFENSFGNVSVEFDKYSPHSLEKSEILGEDKVDWKEERLRSPSENHFDSQEENGLHGAPDSSEVGVVCPGCVAADRGTEIREVIEESKHQQNGRLDGASAPSMVEPLPSDCVTDIDTGIRDTTEVKHSECNPKRHFSSDTGPLSWSAGSMKRIKSRLVRDRRKKDARKKNVGSAREVPEIVFPAPDSQHIHVNMGVNGDYSSYSDLHEPVAELGKNASEERVAEWLWILHRIVVDVVRTDRHLKFYGDAKNMARMSDILAVYAWIDPKTGYCQGMSDLLSPFIVLFDNDADAFWCFESLLSRVRQNFQMEGPVGVMKQLEALSKILEVTDPQMSKHLGDVGADNFLFAFRMLLVLFRRELSFGESLFMWEMMWAADFNPMRAGAQEFNCLEALVLRMPRFLSDSRVVDVNGYLGPPSMSFLSQYGCSSTREFSAENSMSNSNSFGVNFLGRSPFCGLGPGALLTKNRPIIMPTVGPILGRNGDEELSVFCVAAILMQNRNKLLKDIQSMDDAIKTFNDTRLMIRVHSSVRTAIKLRKKYQSWLAKHLSLERWHSLSENLSLSHEA